MTKKYSLILLALILILSFSLAACATVNAEVYPPIDATAWAYDYQAAVLGVTAEIYDDYATYYTPSEFSVIMEDYYGSFAGVGVYISPETSTEVGDGEQEIVRVVGVMEEHPAAAAGVEVGDIVLEVDGQNCIGLTSDDVASYLRGEPDTEVEVLLQRKDEEGQISQILVTIIRAEIESITVEAEFLEQYPHIAYFNIYSFSENTPQEFVDLFNQLESEQGIEALIFDLRSNPGGSFYAAIAIADFFVEAGQPLVWEKTINGEVEHISQDGSLADLPVICLQSRATASAAEVLIGALDDYGVATLIGETTFGKGITQILEPLIDQSGIKYTASRYFTPFKNDLHQLGINPDISIEVPDDILYEDYYDPNNPQNEHIVKAIEALQSQITITELSQ